MGFTVLQEGLHFSENEATGRTYLAEGKRVKGGIAVRNGLILGRVKIGVSN